MSNHCHRRVTRVVWGVKQPSHDEWEHFDIDFPDFPSLPSEKGLGVVSPKFQFCGYDWTLMLFPCGSQSATDGYLSYFLLSYLSPDQTFSVERIINVRYLDGTVAKGTQGAFSFKGKTNVGEFNFMRRSDILSESNPILKRGTLTISVSLKRKHNVELPKAFIPPNKSVATLGKLYQGDKDTDDIIFECKGAGTNSRRVHAHRSVLENFSPILAEMCESFNKSKPVPLPVDAETFTLALKHLYGIPIPSTYWKGRAKEMIDVADRYGFTELKLEAEAWLVHTAPVTSENAVEHLKLANSRSCALLKDEVMKFFRTNKDETFQILRSDDFPLSNSLHTDVLAAMVADDYRDVDSLRREAYMKGLDISGTRETLIKSLSGKDGSK